MVVGGQCLAACFRLVDGHVLCFIAGGGATALELAGFAGWKQSDDQ